GRARVGLHRARPDADPGQAARGGSGDAGSGADRVLLLRTGRVPALLRRVPGAELPVRPAAVSLVGWRAGPRRRRHTARTANRVGALRRDAAVRRRPVSRRSVRAWNWRRLRVFLARGAGARDGRARGGDALDGPG